MEGEEASEDILKVVFEKINAEDSFARQIGIRLIELRTGFARASLSVTGATLNIYQMAHGGAIFSIADQACEAAGNSFGVPAVALQNNLHFLTAGRSGDILEATAKVTHRSSRIGLIEFEVRNQEGHLLANGQQLIFFKRTREQI
jgi:acyl-CoA thioesterase